MADSELVLPDTPKVVPAWEGRGVRAPGTAASLRCQRLSRAAMPPRFQCLPRSLYSLRTNPLISNQSFTPGVHLMNSDGCFPSHCLLYEKHRRLICRWVTPVLRNAAEHPFHSLNELQVYAVPCPGSSAALRRHRSSGARRAGSSPAFFWRAVGRQSVPGALARAVRASGSPGRT